MAHLTARPCIEGHYSTAGRYRSNRGARTGPVL